MKAQRGAGLSDNVTMHAADGSLTARTIVEYREQTFDAAVDVDALYEGWATATILTAGLSLAGNQLAAVFVRLDGTYHDPENKGWWHLEAGFGKCAATITLRLFKTPEDAGAWVEQTLMGKAA